MIDELKPKAEEERVPRAGEPEEVENVAVERTANGVAGELKAAQRDGRVVISLQQLIRTTLQTPQEGYVPMAEKRAWTMVIPVIQRLQDMAKEETAKGDEQLDNALKKLVRPAHDIDKRPESSPDFNPLGINKKE